MSGNLRFSEASGGARGARCSRGRRWRQQLSALPLAVPGLAGEGPKIAAGRGGRRDEDLGPHLVCSARVCFLFFFLTRFRLLNAAGTWSWKCWKGSVEPCRLAISKPALQSAAVALASNLPFRGHTAFPSANKALPASASSNRLPSGQHLRGKWLVVKSATDLRSQQENSKTDRNSIQ